MCKDGRMKISDRNGFTSGGHHSYLRRIFSILLFPSGKRSDRQRGGEEATAATATARPESPDLWAAVV